MRFTRRTVAAPAILLGVALALAGCAGDTEEPTGPVEGAGITDELIAAAQAEGEITFYHGTDLDSTTRWVQAFADEYGIQVVQNRKPSGELFGQYTQEETAGQHFADVITISDVASLLQAKDDGLLAEYELSSAADYDPAITVPGYIYPLHSLNSSTLSFNVQDMSEDEIADIRDQGLWAMADPKYKGRIVMDNPNASLSGVASTSLYVTRQLADEYGWDWAEAVAANGVVFTDSSSTAVNSLVAGEYLLNFGSPDTILANQVIAGAPIQFLYPEIVTNNTWQMAISEGAPHPNAARLFFEWAHTPEGQTSWSEIGQGTPTSSKADDKRAITSVDWWEPPTEVWNTWATDEELVDGADAFLERWNEVFAGAPGLNE